MRKESFLLLLSLAFILISSCARPLLVRKSKLVWEENFNQAGSFDASKWTKIPRGTSDWNRFMSDFDSCYAVRNGYLVLRGMANNGLVNDTASYLTGGVYTKDKVNFGFGRLEIRAKLNGAVGAWPAFWMLPANGRWPDGGEIDIMERLNFDTIAYQTVHSGYTQRLKIRDNPKANGTAPIQPNDFNTYAVEMYPDSLVFYINNKKNFTYPKIDTDKEGQFPFDKDKFYLLIDMQLGGSWVGRIDKQDLPVEMEIDWVRFYEFKPRRR